MKRNSTLSYLSNLKSKEGIVTAIEHGLTFPEKVEFVVAKYKDDILLFQKLVQSSKDSRQLLKKIREDKNFSASRMSLLKIFRRAVSLACDTETTKKILSISTEEIIKNFGEGFKDIKILKQQFLNLNEAEITALACLIGEYDDRGKQGYVLTDMFFSWFEKKFTSFEIIGPRGAGKDVELNLHLEGFKGKCPCDFIIKKNTEIIAIGFARYDSTRGGSQSDDRTGGNLSKVHLVKTFCDVSNKRLGIIFLSDGPGLLHKDTWEESCKLDGMNNGDVLVTTLKLCDQRITNDWLSQYLEKKIPSRAIKKK